MPRSPGAAGMVDVHSTGVAMDYTRTHTPCVAGGNVYKSHIGFSTKRFDLEGHEVTAAPGHTGLCRSVAIDSTRAWISSFAAMIIIAFVFGMIHSFGVFVPYLIEYYKLGMIECICVGCVTYGIIIGLVNFLSTCLIRTMGSKMTGVLGLFLVFLGLLIDSFCLHFVFFYVTHLICLGVGGAIAIAAAMSIASVYFRTKLKLVLFCLCISACLGTIFFIWASDFLLRRIGFRWTKMAYTILTLVVLASCYLFPPEAGYFEKRRLLHRAELIRRCIRENIIGHGENAKIMARCDPQDKDCYECDEVKNHCSCIVVSDCSVWADFSFILWGILGMIAMAALFFPYLYLIFYAIELGILDSYSISLILFLCLGSLCTRILMLMNDYSYNTGKLMFQLACLISGILLILLMYITTFGWLIVWSVGMGVVEGFLIVFIPRLTIATIPTKWLSTCWCWILVFQALGVIAGAIFIILVKACTGKYIAGFITIGVLQIIAAILAFLLPNEEENNADWSVEQAQMEMEQAERERNFNEAFRQSQTGRNSRNPAAEGQGPDEKHVHFEDEDLTKGQRKPSQKHKNPGDGDLRLIADEHNYRSSAHRSTLVQSRERRLSSDETYRSNSRGMPGGGKLGSNTNGHMKGGGSGDQDLRSRSQSIGGDGPGGRYIRRASNRADDRDNNFRNPDRRFTRTSRPSISNQGQGSYNLDNQNQAPRMYTTKNQRYQSCIDEFGQFRGFQGPCTPLEPGRNYEDKCPICEMIGCIPECCPTCAPGGLAGMPDCPPNEIDLDPCSNPDNFNPDGTVKESRIDPNRETISRQTITRTYIEEYSTSSQSTPYIAVPKPVRTQYDYDDREVNWIGSSSDQNSANRPRRRRSTSSEDHRRGGHHQSRRKSHGKKHHSKPRKPSHSSDHKKKRGKSKPRNKNPLSNKKTTVVKSAPADDQSKNIYPKENEVDQREHDKSEIVRQNKSRTVMNRPLSDPDIQSQNQQLTENHSTGFENNRNTNASSSEPEVGEGEENSISRQKSQPDNDNPNDKTVKFTNKNHKPNRKSKNKSKKMRK